MPSTLTGLKVVATPLGNIGDLSPRAKESIANADIVLAEDTRRAARLLNAAGLSAKKLISFFEGNEKERAPEILAALRNGASATLISDAGTPLMADPGYRLVKECRELGVPVSPIPGPSAPIAALSAAGLPPLPFSFLGFLPRGEKAREDLFAAYAHCPGSLVFFERKDRLGDTFALALRVLGDRDAVVCREMTKTHEEFIRGRLKDFARERPDLLGEITAVIGPPETAFRAPPSRVLAAYGEFVAAGVKPRAAARKTAKILAGWSADEIYKLALQS